MTENRGLPDFDSILDELHELLRKLDATSEVDMDRNKLNQLVAFLNDNPSRYGGVDAVSSHTLVTTNGFGQQSFVSVQELPRLAIATKYYEALRAYTAVIDRGLSRMGGSRTGRDSDIFSRFPLLEGQEPSETESDLVEALLANIQQEDVLTVEEIRQLRRFLYDAEWTRIRVGPKIGKKLNRSTDFIESAVITQLELIAASSSGRMPLIEALSAVGITFDDFHMVPSRSPVAAVEGRVTGAENTIYFGAPGTGKTFAIDQLGKEQDARFFRTVFHAEIHSSDFIGGLKPSVDAENIVRYGFQPGPFADAWRYAMNHPSERVFLVIEELNRANAAAVIADLFILLDRDHEGASQYTVDYPTEEFRVWSQSETSNCPETLGLPPNLWLYATINSGDQGVFHLDTAFRRRWRYVHMPISYESVSETPIRIGNGTYPWRHVLRRVNEHLRRHVGVEEDRLIGPYFARLESAGARGGVAGIPDEILAYLWTDVFRHHSRENFFAPTILSMGALLDANRSGGEVFSAQFMATLKDSTAHEP